jgi:hypothetical protein
LDCPPVSWDPSGRLGDPLQVRNTSAQTSKSVRQYAQQAHSYLLSRSRNLYLDSNQQTRNDPLHRNQYGFLCQRPRHQQRDPRGHHRTHQDGLRQILLCSLPRYHWFQFPSCRRRLALAQRRGLSHR